MDHHSQREKFLDTFPVGGRDGTLKTRFQGTPAAGRILAKTGSMESVSTLSGYAETIQGAHLAYSLMENNEVVSQPDVRKSWINFASGSLNWFREQKRSHSIPSAPMKEMIMIPSMPLERTIINPFIFPSRSYSKWIGIPVDQTYRRSQFGLNLYIGR
jgi:hypothetical protein